MAFIFAAVHRLVMDAAPLHLKWRAAFYAFTGLRHFH